MTNFQSIPLQKEDLTLPGTKLARNVKQIMEISNDLEALTGIGGISSIKPAPAKINECARKLEELDNSYRELCEDQRNRRHEQTTYTAQWKKAVEQRAG